MRPNLHMQPKCNLAQAVRRARKRIAMGRGRNGGGRGRGRGRGRGGKRKRKRKAAADDCDFREQQRAKLRATLDRRVTEALHGQMDKMQQRPTVSDAMTALDDYKFPSQPLTFYARMDEARRAHAVSVSTREYVADILDKAWLSWERRQHLKTRSAGTAPPTDTTDDHLASHGGGNRRVCAKGLLAALKVAERMAAPPGGGVK